MITLAVLLAVFVTLQSFLPLRTTVQVGGDEGFELAKATLCLKGFHLYSDVWNDQPPLHTLIVTQVLKHISPSILGPRLITSAFAMLLLSAVFFICLRIHGLVVATLTTAFLIFSPGFLELASSCMLEIPALAPAVTALGILLWHRTWKWVVFGGLLFGIGLDMKLIVLILLPIAILIVWLNSSGKMAAKSWLVFGTSMAFSFIAIDWLTDGGAFLLHFKQTWISHFAPTQSFEYGSPSDHPFEWNILLRNWDTTIPAVIGFAFLLTRFRNSLAMVPVVWLVLMFGIFAVHRPWWSYYYVHLAIPLCWCAAIAFETARQKILAQRSKVYGVLLVISTLCVAAWMSARVYLQIVTIRNSPQTYSSLVLVEIERYKPFANWIYADKPVYSFHTGIPMPPTLAVIPLKRLWSGDITNDKINSEMGRFKPELILLANDTRVLPFKVLLDSEYRLVYQDVENRLYAHKAIASKAQE
jgi:hypothetical protein